MALTSRFAVPAHDPGFPNGSFHASRPSDVSIASMSTADYDLSSSSVNHSQESLKDTSTLTPREALELFENAVDNARQGVQSLAGNAKAREVAKLGLTLDLKNCRLDRIPNEVADIIRQDVERLQLAHNTLRDIPSNFTTCSILRYLNLRDNRFQEMPKAVFGMPQLEILDLSKNGLSTVPNDIDKMKSLRVFAIHHNRIEDLPLGLGNIGTLRMLKLAGNPLNAYLKQVTDGSEDVMSPSTPALPIDENEKDKLLTQAVIKYLRNPHFPQLPPKESEEESSDAPLETPRAISRFPVQPFRPSHRPAPSTSESEMSSDQRSPAFMKPNINPRSHYRVPSYQNNALQASTSALRRPGLAPLSLGNERNRSNSESILQASQNTKSKRMGIVSKKQPELGILDETRAHRNSHHFRGQSHGSALRTGYKPSESSPTSTMSPKIYKGGTFVRRLSSLPEQRRPKPTISRNQVIEAAKGMLYSLHLVHPQLATLMTVIKDSRSRRSSLERVYHNAAMHLKHLDEQISQYETSQPRSKKLEEASKKIICRASHACVVAYQQVGGILLSNIEDFVRSGDHRYIRTFVMMLYGSFHEGRNARQSARKGRNVETSFQAPVNGSPATKRVSEDAASPNRARSITPTQERIKPGKRWNGGSINQQSLDLSGLGIPAGQPSRLADTQTMPAAVPSRMNGLQSSSLAQANGAEADEQVPSNHSRSDGHAGPIYSSASSSVVSTPASNDTFGSNLLVPRSRSGSVARNSERITQAHIELDQFERIFLTLNRAIDQGLQVIPYLEPRFIESSEQSRRVYTMPHIQELWTILIDRTRCCLEMSESLKHRLSIIKLNDPDARNAPDFWRLAKRFVDCYSELLLSLREARTHQLIDNRIRDLLRPVHKSTVEAAKLMNDFPWSRLASSISDESEIGFQPQSTIHSRAPTPVMHHPHGGNNKSSALSLPPLHMQPPPPTPVLVQPTSRSQSVSRNGNGNSNDSSYYHRRAGGPKGSNDSNVVISPASYGMTIPATPLSAALGPAAQATVPSTPSTGAGLNRSFEGDVFQRAEYLQQNTIRRVA